MSIVNAARFVLLGLLPGLLQPGAAWAAPAPYPSQPVSLVVGYAAGGSVDLVARALAPGLAQRLGQPVNVENIAGASGAIGAVRVALAPSDGHTLLLGSPSEVGINHLTSKRVKFDPLKDTTPIVLVGSQPLVLVAAPSLKVGTIDEFLAYVRARPGRTQYGSSGLGTPLHLAGETLNQRAQLSMVHTPYRGAGPMLPDLQSGRLDFAVMVLSSALPHIREGRLRAIGLTQPGRSAVAPEIPALGAHPALSGVDVSVWFGVLGPAKLPAAVRDRVRDEVRALLREDALRTRLQASGLALAENTEFQPFLLSEIQKFQRIVRAARLAE